MIIHAVLVGKKFNVKYFKIHYFSLFLCLSFFLSRESIAFLFIFLKYFND